MKINDMVYGKQEINRLNCVVDTDDVLLDFVGGYIIYHNLKYGTNLKKEDFTTYSFGRAENEITKGEDKIYDFYKTKGFRELQPLPHAVEVINNLKEKNNLYNVTSRPDFIHTETIEDILKYFSNSFLNIFFSINHYTGRKNSGKTKAEYCLELNASLIIEDSLEYALQCADAGIKVLLLRQPWNKKGKHTNITRVENWKEIGDLLLK